ncbi:MAG TPA: hypothetical protein VGZ50_09230 [Actinomycetota bacterium]|jgi:hypothetical protein|nr:hypothetical protein [Actinomycetota bacterium]
MRIRAPGDVHRDGLAGLILRGGSGTDRLLGGKGEDACAGSSGKDTATDCESQSGSG